MENKKEYAKIRIVSENGQVSAEIESNSVADLILAIVKSTEKILNSLQGLDEANAIALKSILLSLIIDGEVTEENLEKHGKSLLKDKQVS